MTPNLSPTTTREYKTIAWGVLWLGFCCEVNDSVMNATSIFLLEKLFASCRLKNSQLKKTLTRKLYSRSEEFTMKTSRHRALLLAIVYDN